MKNRHLPVRYLLGFSTFMLTVLLYVDRACISAAKDEISADLNFNMKDFGWVMAVFTLGYALFQVPAGNLSDRKGPRRILAGIVGIWSLFTALTGMARNFLSMLLVRFFFGAGEAGAFPGLARVVFNWFPVRERGIIQGINFSGSRIGAAFALPLVAAVVGSVGWRTTFVIFGMAGGLFALLWYLLFRNHPGDSRIVSAKEKELILGNREPTERDDFQKGSIRAILASRNIWLAMLQYIASNFTFYFTLTWMYPYLKDRFSMGGVEAGIYSMIPLLAGAAGNWISGLWVDRLFRRRGIRISRRLPAITGFVLAALGMLVMANVHQPRPAIIFLALAIFGADMTLSPSWAFCIDTGKERSGAVSGMMNMAGNLGAFVMIIAFPYLYGWTGSFQPFFYLCILLSALAVVFWTRMDPKASI